MGTQKLLLPWAGKTVIEHVVDPLLASRVDQVLVITGHDHEPLQRTLANYPVTLEYNDQYTQGMLSSVRCGLKALPENCTGVLVALGDQPTLKVSTVNCLLDQFLQHPQIVLPTYQGRRGHPLLFSCAYASEILTQYDGTGSAFLEKVPAVFKMNKTLGLALSAGGSEKNISVSAPIAVTPAKSA